MIRVSILVQDGALRAPRGAALTQPASARAGRAASGRSPRGTRLLDCRSGPASGDACTSRAATRSRNDPLLLRLTSEVEVAGLRRDALDLDGIQC